MQARVKAGWITEADLREAGAKKPSKNQRKREVTRPACSQLLDDSALDSGPRKGAATERICVVTRDVRPVEDTDPLCRRSGRRRGAGHQAQICRDAALWVTRDPIRRVDQAVRRKLFARGFKRDVRTDAESGR